MSDVWERIKITTKNGAYFGITPPQWFLDKWMATRVGTNYLDFLSKYLSDLELELLIDE